MTKSDNKDIIQPEENEIIVDKNVLTGLFNFAVQLRPAEKMNVSDVTNFTIEFQKLLTGK